MLFPTKDGVKASFFGAAQPRLIVKSGAFMFLTNPTMATWPKLFANPASNTSTSLHRCLLMKLLILPSLQLALTLRLLSTLVAAAWQHALAELAPELCV
jgi:hypothetical protein